MSSSYSCQPMTENPACPDCGATTHWVKSDARWCLGQLNPAWCDPCEGKADYEASGEHLQWFHEAIYCETQ